MVARAIGLVECATASAAGTIGGQRVGGCWKGRRPMRRFRVQRFAVAATLALSITLAAVPALLAQSTPAEVALARLNFYGKPRAWAC